MRHDGESGAPLDAAQRGVHPGGVSVILGTRNASMVPDAVPAAVPRVADRRRVTVS